MAMHVIIDGYNLLGIRGMMGTTASQEGEHMREGLIQELSGYQHRKGHSITVVFDAWRERTTLEHREHRAGVQVVYTRGGERADQVIQRLVRQHGKACVVVSSDLEIMNTARDHGALTMKSQEFHNKLRSVVKSRTTSKRASIQPASSAYGKVEDEVSTTRPDKKGNPRKLPKAKRRRHRQLKGF